MREEQIEQLRRALQLEDQLEELLECVRLGRLVKQVVALGHHITLFRFGKWKGALGTPRMYNDEGYGQVLGLPEFDSLEDLLNWIVLCRPNLFETEGYTAEEDYQRRRQEA